MPILEKYAFRCILDKRVKGKEVGYGKYETYLSVFIRDDFSI